jgi:hypothetical protein
MPIHASGTKCQRDAHRDESRARSACARLVVLMAAMSYATGAQAVELAASTDAADPAVADYVESCQTAAHARLWHDAQIEEDIAGASEQSRATDGPETLARNLDRFTEARTFERLTWACPDSRARRQGP